ncbi:MAG: hypothetical protein AUH43_17865 [Acidobacteria bacterium 13_1_40CM_65_14]|nr:MAG: hypothetical protein AUH43_17865 [Acidobacteria bacterium 13_1_40CM_65_14]
MPSVQPRLQRLILHLQHRARFFGRHPVKITKHDWRAINRRQRENRAQHAAAELRAQHLLVRHVAPVRHVGARERRILVTASFRLPCLVLRSLIARGPQPRHRRIERDAIDPRRQRRVAAKRVHLAVDLQQHVLYDLFGVFLVAEISKCELIDFSPVGIRQFGDRSLVACL